MSTFTSSEFQKFKNIMDEVYGPYKTGWKPNPYADNKSRYLWTDAFGVVNYLTLYYTSGKDAKFLEQAEILIEDVHNILGKDRKGRKRLGAATDEHPTVSGLRIGKEADEGDSDGDGQYFHYLTKWAYALNRMSLVKKDPKFNMWAIELMHGVFPNFLHYSRKEPHLYWKISIDMSTPWVKSEGNLDPYDGFVTCRIIRDTSGDSSVLKEEIETLGKMVDSKYASYESNDPLDLGEALWIGHWYTDELWAKTVSTRSVKGLDSLYRRGYFDRLLNFRLGFREFGTTLGVQVNPVAGPEWVKRAKELELVWSNHLFTRDKDITPVMYCASLIPGVWSKNASYN
jgi:hypothetical protein